MTRIDAAGITRDARFRKANRVKSIQSSLQIEANSLKIDQVTAIFEGECVIGPAKDILEVNNAIRAYNLIPCLDPYSKGDLLRAHGAMMEDLTEQSGMFRTAGVNVVNSRTGEVIHYPHLC